MGLENFGDTLGRLAESAHSSDSDTDKSKETGADNSDIPMGSFAYIGDAIYELWARLISIDEGVGTGQDLHRSVVKRVRAEAQADVLKSIEDRLSSEEKDFIRRARNIKTGSVPKNASPGEYRLATAFEALLGQLMWSGNLDRLVEILNIIESN